MSLVTCFRMGTLHVGVNQCFACGCSPSNKWPQNASKTLCFCNCPLERLIVEVPTIPDTGIAPEAWDVEPWPFVCSVSTGLAGLFPLFCNDEDVMVASLETMVIRLTDCSNSCQYFAMKELTVHICCQQLHYHSHSWDTAQPVPEALEKV